MANGQQLTPFDMNDIGGQLLQALVQAEQTKQGREQLKLREKELGLQEKQMQLQGAGQLAPDARANVLSSIFGQQVSPEQVYQSPAEQQFADLKKYLGENPDINETFMNLQATGQPFGAQEGLEAARIAARMKASATDRIEAGRQLLSQFGSAAVAAWDVLAGSELGVRAPRGVPTLEERAVEAGEKQARVAGATAEAARVRAKQDLVELFAGGFQKTDPKMPDAEFDAAVGDLIEWAANPSGEVLDPAVLRKIVPTSKYAAILAASAKVPPQVEARLDLLKTLYTHVNEQKGKVPQETLDLLQELTLGLMEDLSPTPEEPEGAAPAEAPAGGAATFSWLLDKVMGGPSVPRTLSGRPLKPEVQAILNKTASGFGPMGVLKSLRPEFRLLESALKALDKVYNKILPLITDAAGRPVPAQPTLGPLANPARAVPPDARQKLQSLSAAYRAAGASDQDVLDLESDLSEVIDSGDQEAIESTFDAVLAEIEDMRKERGR